MIFSATPMIFSATPMGFQRGYQGSIEAGRWVRVTAPIEQPGMIQLSQTMTGDRCVLTVHGVLDGTSSRLMRRLLRDTIIEAAPGLPETVIVDG
jgi:hypothetical protein